jgi:hypothetical protein
MTTILDVMALVDLLESWVAEGIKMKLAEI